MNEFDERYDIRLATVDDIDSIMRFIDEHWKHGHIMAVNRSFFEYEFLEEDGTVNFILAIDKKKRTIESMAGFLKASHDSERMDIWGSFWKTLDGNMVMLGTEIVLRLERMTNCRCNLAVGNNPKTSVIIWKYVFKRNTAKMSHYYMLSDIEDFKIAKIKYRPVCIVGDDAYRVIELKDIGEVKKRFDTGKFKENIPYKDYWYIEHRFFNHPIYRYNIYGIENNEGVVDALIVIRNQEYDGRTAIRLVDYIGDRNLISGIGAFLRELLMSVPNAEYIDFYCRGLDEKSVMEAGFSIISENDENIIPNYFGPFVQENIDIWVNYGDESSLFTKADGDQDRPSIS